MFNPGSIVRARGREWIVLPGSEEDELLVRPLSGSAEDETLIVPALEPVPPESATFAPPDPARAGNCAQARLLADALRLKLRNGAGPFRSFGNIALRPRSYQLVPLLMALKQPVSRLLIADDVGIGKTIEAGLVLRELLDRGDVRRAAVLCPPHLVGQWCSELSDRFHIRAEALTSRTAARIEREVPAGESPFEHFPFLVVSLDYIKQQNRRDAFLAYAPEFVVVDEAHACTQLGTGKQYRWELLKKLAEDPARHLLLLTATPHSGNRRGFANLLSLLDPEFARLEDPSLSETEHRRLRQKLAGFFVQRRRIDIEKTWSGEDIFPKRMIREVTYRLSGSWVGFFDKIYTYCRDLARREEAAGMRRSMIWYSTLALLRCASSSPAAAIRAFSSAFERTAAEESVAAPGPDGEAPSSPTEDTEPDFSRITDDPEEDAPESDFEPELPAGAARARASSARELRALAQSLLDEGSDPKLARLVGILKDLLKDGFHPVVFCRYVATADYVADALRARLSGVAVRAVTGRLSPDDREDAVRELAEEEGKRVLVATDCLSEGINLQKDFDAVVHYDLSWNPTRHEQREGRVDRYGQPAREVRCVLLWGQDNPVDGLVLDVITHKAAEIKKELGVVVPVPADTARLNEALLQAVLLRRSGRDDDRQLTFEEQLFADEAERDLEALDGAWTDALEREKSVRRVFAQQALKPDDVLPELRRAADALGGEADAERFVRAALAALGAPLSPWRNAPGRFAFDPAALPESLRERLVEAGIRVDRRFAFAFEERLSTSAVSFLHRSHPLVEALADYVAESALSPVPVPEGVLPASRCAAMSTAEVSRRTTLFLLRLRHRLEKAGSAPVIAEELCFLAAEGAASAPAWSDDRDLAGKLLRAAPAGNLAPDAQSRAIESGLALAAAADAPFADLAKRRAEALLADHRRVRDAAGARGAWTVSPILPVDVVGLYVFLPAL